MGAMPDDPQNSPRRPFGERDTEERNLPFGARPPTQRPDAPRIPDAPRSSDAAPDPEEPLEAAPQEEPNPAPPRRAESESFQSPFAPRVQDEPDEAPPGTRQYEQATTTIEEAMGANGKQEAYSKPDEPALDEEEAAPSEPELNDEPEDAPGIIAVRSQHRKGITDTGILKRRALQEAQEAASGKKAFRSYPAQEAAEVERQAAREAAAQRAQVALQVRVVFQTIGVIFASAAVIATVLTWWTPNTFISAESMNRLSEALATQTAPAVDFLPTLTPIGGSNAAILAAERNQVIGIVSGHKGPDKTTGQPNPGVVCADGTTEQQTVETIANQVGDLINGAGYTVDVLDEFDPRLNGYSALAVISIHADACEYINDEATGFKVAGFTEATNPTEDSKLVSCMIARYGDTTHLVFHPTVTYDMTQYHGFGELKPGTPGAVIDVGYLYLDKEVLSRQTNVVALGVARGLLCYLRGEPINANNTAEPTATP